MQEVTVLMPVYNAMPYLVEAVDSILAQTYRHFLFLIIDDGSTDGTREYLKGLRDERLWIIHQDNRGLGATLNKGIAMCDTEYIARMDADDISLPGRLEAQLSFLDRHPEVGMVGTRFAFIGVTGRRGMSPPMPSEHDAIYADLLRCRHAISHPSIICRTAVLKKVGGYQVEDIGEDWDLFLRMGEVAKLANLNEILYLYRLNYGSVSVRRFMDVRLRYNHACHCAQRRVQGLPEISYEEFLAERDTRPILQRIGDVMDFYAVGQYRRALAEILGSRRMRGYARLIFSAFISPRWTSQRISREIRRRLS